MALQSTTALAKITLLEASSTVEFSGIPDTYRDLSLVIQWANTTSTGSNVGLRFNSDLGNNYPHVAMYYDGSSSNYASGTQPYIYVFYGATTVDLMATCEIVDYSATDKHTTTLSCSGGGTYRTYAWAGRWANTAAVNSIEVLNTATNFAAGTTIALFGRIA